MLKIEKIDDTTFDVTVEATTKTKHRVTISEAYYQKLTGGKVSKEELLRASFEFLLARESNTSILRTFDLPVIGKYFPEYEAEILLRD